MADVLTIKKGERTAQVVKSAYDNVWKKRGWEEASDDDAARPQSSGPTRQVVPNTKKGDDS